MINLITNCPRCIHYEHRYSDIEYIVVHYPGNTATALNQAKYYSRCSRVVSAHFVVDSDGSVYQTLGCNLSAYHVVSSKKCTNKNSIGIDLCALKLNTSSNKASDDDWYHSDMCMNSAAQLVSFLMNKYNIPIYRVLRHNDVTGKICPASMCGRKKNKYYGVSGDDVWIKFKGMILNAGKVNNHE